MLVYAKDYNASLLELDIIMKALKKKGHNILVKKTRVVDDLSITRYTIKAKSHASKRLVFTSGVHGIEGFVGHAAVKVFFDDLFPSLENDVEVIIYHPINPFGMKHFRRTNENNVDLNRNFTSNNFTSENEAYKTMDSFFQPKQHKSKQSANLAFYASLTNHIRKYGITTFKDATLFGQKSNPKGIYYSSDTSTFSTNYVLGEMKKLFVDIKDIVWIDLHTGYGPRYQMSVVNSQYEKEQSKELIASITYPRVLGLEEDDFYDIDGDMIEKIYEVHKEGAYQSSLFATCFEFGTYGDSTKNVISSLKAMIFENDSFFENQKDSFSKFANSLIKKQFMPDESKWLKKAHEDFNFATSDILGYYSFMK